MTQRMDRSSRLEWERRTSG